MIQITPDNEIKHVPLLYSNMIVSLSVLSVRLYVIVRPLFSLTTTLQELQ